MSGIARFVGGLFGGQPRVQKLPSPVAPAPNIGDAGGEAAARLAAARAGRRKGYEDTILTAPTLGRVGGGVRNINVKPLLG